MELIALQWRRRQLDRSARYVSMEGRRLAGETCAEHMVRHPADTDSIPRFPAAWWLALVLLGGGGREGKGEGGRPCA